MAFPDLFKLEKLKIQAYKDRGRANLLDTFEAMFNPATINQNFSVQYKTTPLINGLPGPAEFVRSDQADLALTLLLDGTGVDQIGLLTIFGGAKTVLQRITDFLRIVHNVVPETHEPPFLTVIWGKWGTEIANTGFRGRLKKVDIRYTSIDRDGAPLRAELDLAIVADASLDRQGTLAGLSSPDVTHSRTVREGDTLPLLTREIYGSSRHVVEVARVNGLDTLRALDAGSELIFPPIAG